MSVPIAAVITWLLATMRLGTLFMLIPLYGGRFLPAQVRIALILLISVLVVPHVEVVDFTSINIWQIVFMGIGELLVGLVLGLCVRSFFAVIEVAGMLISRNIGLMMAQQFDPASGSNSNLIGIILFYFAAILFFIIGGHHHVIHNLVRSYEVIGIAKDTLVLGNPNAIMGILSQVFALAASMAAPFIAVDFIITLGFGVLGKVAPKINVMMISFSFRIVGGLVIFFITGNLIFNFLLHYSEEVPKSMLEFLIH